MPNILMHELVHIVLHPLSGCNYYDAASDDVQLDTYSIDKRRWVSAVGTYKREVRLVKLPNVLRLVRQHFNCPTLDGVEVDTTKDTPEKINHDRLAFAHFEARLFPDSLLSPYYLEGNVVTKLEIALFVDSGWYVVNESLGRPLTVTRGKGCEFATMSCYEYMNKYKFDPVKIYPYCTAAEKDKWMCSLDGRRASYCLGSYYHEDDIHDAYKLKDGFVGYNYFTYCPMIVPKTLEDSSPYCDFSENVDFRSVGSYGGSPFQSMCLRFPYLSVFSSKWHCPLSFHSSPVGVCVKFSCRPNGILFEFAGRRFFCLATQGGRKFSHNTRSKPYGCFMKFEFCCPDFAMCSKNTTYQFTKESLNMC
uniref:Leishmanolysin-like peptidase n=1 Tax=Romanomermis culicivorax TaxID=13658 RepID=A0A915KAY2_ROMCU